MWRLAGIVFAIALLASWAHAADTTSCEGKRSWQEQIVRDAVRAWFADNPDPDDLVELVQAEHGIAACGAGHGAPARLHTTSLPRGLELDQLGAVLLANELAWAGLVPRPEAGLAGEYFRVLPARRFEERPEEIGYGAQAP